MNLDSLKLPKSKEKDSLVPIRSYASNVLQNLVDCHYTDHSIEHSLRIIKIIDRILIQTRNSELLTNLEKYVLQAAAFLHDIGMQEEKAIPISRERREYHEDLSIIRIEKDWSKISILEDMVGPICAVIKAHRGKFSNEKEQTVRTCEQIRIDLLERLLFLADELDITHERIDITSKDRLRYDLDNYKHLYKHYYTEAIDIADNRGISIIFRYPKDRINEYKILQERFVASKIRKSLDSVNAILNLKYKIDLFLDEISHRELTSLEMMDVDIYEKIIAQEFLPKSVRLLKSFNFDEMKNCHDPDLFYNGSVNWEDVVNNLDVSRNQLLEIKQKSEKLLKSSCKNQSHSLIVITGEAGSGKSTLLMRLAYDMSCDPNLKKINLLWYDGKDQYEPKKILRYYESNIEPIIVFIDTPDIHSFVEDVYRAKNDLEKSAAPILMIVTARQSEWDNVHGEERIPAKEKDFIKLNRLDDKEIQGLLKKLEAHNKLGVLESLTPAERFIEFKKHCERQLLVAMLEATRGDNFEKIIINEYMNLHKICPEAAKAYELVALFHMYFVSTPKSLLIRLLMCDDEKDFYQKVLSHTRLIIVRDSSQPYHEYYKARHAEIAKTLINELGHDNSEIDKLKRVGMVINYIDPFLRHERYHIINFLKNCIADISKNKYSENIYDKINNLRALVERKHEKIGRLIEMAHSEKRISELVTLSAIFRKLRLIKLNICTLKKILEINPTDKKANYYLATALTRSKIYIENPEIVAEYYRNAYLGGNRDIRFLLDYVSYCAKFKIYNHLDPFLEGIDDFLTHTQKELIFEKKLVAILKGYKATRSIDKLVQDTADLLQHISITRNLSAEDEIAYIDLYESTDPKRALMQCEKYLLEIKPNRPKSTLLRIAHIANKIPGEEPNALAHYKELFDRYISDSQNPEDFPIVSEYFKLALKLNACQKERYYMLFQVARKMNSAGISLYADFAEYLINNGNDKDLKFCQRMVSDGLTIAVQTGKQYSNFARKLRVLKEKL